MAQVGTIVNKFGKVIGWNDVKVHLLGRDLEGITKIEYSDEVSIEAVYGAGNMPVGYSEGNYQATAKITILKEELLGLQRSLPPGMRLQDIPPFDIAVVYEVNGQVFKDIIRNCKFKNSGTSLSQNDGKTEIDLDLFTTHIDWNVK